MPKVKQVHVMAPYDGLPEPVKQELAYYIIEGNSIEDLAVQFLSSLNRDGLLELLREIKAHHNEIGDMNTPIQVTEFD